MAATLNVTISGRGPAVVFLHPVGLDSTTWADVAAIVAANFTTVLFDLPGHGRSPRLPAGAKIPDYARAVLQTLDALGLERPIIVGGSFGGMIGQTLAIDHPERVKALVISACPPGTKAEDRAMVAKRGEDARSGGMQAVVEATLTRWFTQAFRESETFRDYRRRILADDAEGWAAGWFAISNFDERPRLPSLRVPTLCIAGREDVSAPLAVMREMAAAIPATRLAIIENGPHMLHVEQPRAFCDALAGFLAEHAGSA